MFVSNSPVSCVCNHCKHGPAGHCQSDFARTKTSRAFRIMTWWRAPHPITGQGMSLTRCHTLMLHTMPNLSMPKLMCVSGGKIEQVLCFTTEPWYIILQYLSVFDPKDNCEHAAWGNGMWPLFHCANCWIASPLQPLDHLRYIWSYTSIYVIINPYSLSSLWRRFSSQEDLQRHFRDWKLWHLWIKAFPAADHAIRGSRPCRKQKMLENWKKNWKMLDFQMSSCQFSQFICDSSDSSDSVTAAVDVWLRRDGGASWWTASGGGRKPNECSKSLMNLCRGTVPKMSAMIIHELRIPISQPLFWRQAFDTGFLEVMVKCQIEVEVLQPQAPEQMVWFPVLPAMSDEVRQVFRNMTACWQQIDGM